MSSFFLKKIESYSTEFDTYSKKDSYQEINQITFSTKKSEIKEKKKIFEIKKDSSKKSKQIQLSSIAIQAKSPLKK